jgi:hypothetical protein
MRYALGKSRVSSKTVLVALVCGMATFFMLPLVVEATNGPPDIGGNPFQTSLATIQQDSLDVEIYSYVYEATDQSADIPASLPVPDPDLPEWLYVYLLHMGDEPNNFPVSVTGFDVNNLFRVMINQVGADNEIVPNEGQPGEFTGDRQLPSGFQSNLLAGKVSYLFDDPSTLDPVSDPDGEYSIVYFLVEGPPGDVNGIVDTQSGQFDLSELEQSLIGPVPEPAPFAMLLVGLLFLLRKKPRLG